MNATSRSGTEIEPKPFALPFTPLSVILTLYLVLALAYTLTVPIFEAPDEPAHFIYADELAAGKGLPILDYSSWPEEYHQPPLYYWLVAAILRWFDTSDYMQFTISNPHAAISDASTVGNKNAFLHDLEYEKWPFRGLPLAVHMGRLVSIGLGTVTVCATYSLSLKLFSSSSPRSDNAVPGKDTPTVRPILLAATAAAVVAFNPQFLFVSSALNNDNAVTALSSLALWAAVVYYERPRSMRWLIILGTLSGLTILTKTTGLAVVALMLGVITVKAIRHRLLGMLWLDIGVIILATAFIGGWWYARNAYLYADPFLSRYIYRLSDEAAPRTAIGILRRFEQGEISFWGAFGWLNIAWEEWVYKLLRTWTRLSAAGLLILSIRWLRGERTRVSIPPLVIIFTWVGLIAAMLTQWIMVAGGLQGRLLFPAISALAMLLIAGWTSLVPRRWELAAAIIPAVGLASLAIATPLTTIAPAYARPQMLSANALPSDTIQTDLNYADRVSLMGYHISPSIAHPGSWVDLTLYWHVLDAIPGDFSVYVHLFGRDRQRIGTIDTYPGLGNFPTSQWKPGEVIQDKYPIPIRSDAMSPTLVTITVGWYDFYGSREGIPAEDFSGRPTTVVGTFKLVPEVWPDSNPNHGLRVDFENIVTLVGYDVQLDADTRRLNITLHWRCDVSATANLTVFVHLVDTDGNIIVQMDRPPLNGDYPTWAWEPGEVIQDRLEVALPSGGLQVPPKDKILSDALWLKVGLYNPDGGARLHVLDAAGNIVGDGVILPTPVKIP